MPYDPRMLQMAQQGVRMMGPEPSPFDRTVPQRPKEWWEQPLPMQRKDQSADQSADPSQSVNRPTYEPRQPPSLLQMLMLGGVPSYSGTPRPGPSNHPPWGWSGGSGGKS